MLISGEDCADPDRSCPDLTEPRQKCHGENLKIRQSPDPLLPLRCQRFDTGFVTFFCQPLDVQIHTFGSVFYIFIIVLCPLSGLKTHREPNLQRTKNAR